MFQVNFGQCNGAFGVPNQVVDKYLQLSGALSLKVLLLLLRRGEPMSAAQLAELLNQSEVDVKDALNYWVQLGLVVNGEEPALATMTEAAAAPVAKKETKPEQVIEDSKVPSKEPAKEPTKQVLKERFYRMNRHDVNAVAQTDGNVGVLLEESQNILSRTLSSGEGETLVSLYHHYGMALDIIIMLLQYCKTIGKDSPAYYERMAVDWVNREINTHERAEAELVKMSEVSQLEERMRKLFGIYNRGITKKEKEFFEIWTKEYKTSEAMIKLAFERTIDINGKVSFHYTNAIIKAWTEKGITTPAQAEKDIKPEYNKASSKEKTTKPADSSYDLSELDKMIATGSVWD